MKKSILCLLGCWMAVSGCREAPPDSDWLTSVPDAEAQAKKENKLVFLNFTGSDWCINCKQLDDQIFSKKEFSDYAKSNLVLVTVDYPTIQKKQPASLAKANQELHDKYNIVGVPTLIVLKPDGEAVWTNLGVPDGGPAALIAKLEEAKKK